jgi:hypothetical protein
MKFIPVLIIWPQLGVGERHADAEELRPASSIMASGMARTNPTMMGETEFGIR